MTTKAKRITVGLLFILIFPFYSAAQKDEIAVTVTIERFAAVLVTAPGDKTADPGEKLIYNFTVQNVGNVSDTYDLSASSSNGWKTNLPAGNTLGPLTPEEDPVPVVVELTIPTAAEPGIEDRLTLTATSQHDPDASESAGATTTVNFTTNHPPVLAPIGDKSVDEGKFLFFRITASDPDGDKLAFTIVDIPEGARFLQFRNRTYFWWRPGYEQTGIYKVTFAVTDDGDPSLSDFETISITVNDVER